MEAGVVEVRGTVEFAEVPAKQHVHASCEEPSRCRNVCVLFHMTA